MGRQAIFRILVVVTVIVLLTLGAVGIAHVLSGPTQRDLGPGVVVDQPPTDPPGTGSDPSPGYEEPTPKVGDPPASGKSTPKPSPTPKPTPSRSHGPVKPLPPTSPSTPRVTDDDDDDDDWDDDQWDDDDDYDDD